MGLFSKGADSLGGGNRAPWFHGNGKALIRLTTATAKINRSNKAQTVITAKVIAAEEGCDLVLGREYAYRYEADGRYPESDAAEYLGFILGFAGLRHDANDLSVLLEGLGLDAGDYNLESEKGMALAKIDIDEKVTELRDQLESGEGDAWKDRVCEIRLYTKNEGGYCKMYASAIPAFMVEDGSLTEKGAAALSRTGWRFGGAASAAA